ncbi:related to VPS72 - component of the SWR1 complex, required for vacuolar protein sorting [Ustilago trichophora]|uniref:Related to VPS72 - component of the SWR1 complex, required for vacuolar protein sorting n=1 Tax=Ustilago trichophora TaxID=86804 RepID=A0A5C3ELA1_9BASI|nr:related to VPS72 - component of the SWR1 complex, required for vacuolar protein sorting [Ustilago trichophora]
MSRLRSSPIVGSSRSPSPDPQPSTSYRIERFDPTHASRSSDLMVTSRSKRSTAGNRLKALLDQELEKDEIFAEVENDIDFEAKEDEDGVDIVDSDFDRDSDDDARNFDEDESEGEREIEAAEKAEKQKRRAAARAVGIVKRPTAAPRITRRPFSSSTSSAAQEETSAKRRRISFAPDQPTSSSTGASSTTAADSNRRTSARAATVASKLEVESRLEEASQRRAAQPAKVVVKKKASLTQDALIAEALEVEEENRESLRRFLEQEEERRAKQRQRKERITGPFVRWMSVGLKVKVVDEAAEEKKEEEEEEEEEKKKKDKEKVGEAERDKVKEIDGLQREEVGATEEVGGQALGTSAQPGDASKAETPLNPVPAIEERRADKNGKSDSVPADCPASVPEPKPQDEAAETTKPSSIGDGDVVMAEATVEPTRASSPPPPPEAPSALLPPTPTSSDKTAVQPSALPTQPTPSSSSLTLDPAIAARKETVALRTSLNPLQPSNSTLDHPSTLSAAATAKTELQSRTILTLERAPEDFTWLDEYNALLGTHCTWDSFPYVPSRNRPLRTRQSICPITGLPAIYRDPRTGIPYANAGAYKVLTKVLEGRFIWTGGRFESSMQRGESEKEKGKKRDKGERGEKEARGGGKMGKGAVPVEMGIYVDDESEPGPGKVWETARAAPRTTTSSTTTTTTTSKQIQPTSSSPSSFSNPPETSRSEETAEAEEAAKKKSKPGFDVILTNAIAPGDEKAVLAAALSLPAGSTRSGRRVQRS